LQVSTIGVGPWHTKPAAPAQLSTPGQLPTPGTSFVHGPPPPTPSSTTKSQSLSFPSQVSVAGVDAVQDDQPVEPEQVCVPQHVPIEFVTEHVRCAPSSPMLHVQLPVTGWQNIPVCVPFGSGPHE
jgi:hypothetical protein